MLKHGGFTGPLTAVLGWVLGAGVIWPMGQRRTREADHQVPSVGQLREEAVRGQSAHGGQKVGAQAFAGEQVVAPTGVAQVEAAAVQVGQGQRRAQHGAHQRVAVGVVGHHISKGLLQLQVGAVSHGGADVSHQTHAASGQVLVGAGHHLGAQLEPAPGTMAVVQPHGCGLRAVSGFCAPQGKQCVPVTGVHHGLQLGQGQLSGPRRRIKPQG